MLSKRSTLSRFECSDSLLTKFCISQTRQGATGLSFHMIAHHMKFKQPSSIVTRREVSPNSVDIGQVAQGTLKFRALQQSDGGFVFRELLKSISILDEGISAVREIPI